MADAWMVSEANHEAIEDVKLSYIIGAPGPPRSPTRSRNGARSIPGLEIADGQSSPSPGPSPEPIRGTT